MRMYLWIYVYVYLYIILKYILNPTEDTTLHYSTVPTIMMNSIFVYSVSHRTVVRSECFDGLFNLPGNVE
jgi:hypothetical protein